MRIACAQYSPQVGDIDNNLTRADAVLHKAKAEQLEDLDLLVLPELAFTGKPSQTFSCAFAETGEPGHDAQRTKYDTCHTRSHCYRSTIYHHFATVDP